MLRSMTCGMVDGTRPGMLISGGIRVNDDEVATDISVAVLMNGAVMFVPIDEALFEDMKYSDLTWPSVASLGVNFL